MTDPTYAKNYILMANCTTQNFLKIKKHTAKLMVKSLQIYNKKEKKEKTVLEVKSPL